ncbi:MAG: vWA domain-containing protein [Verrucomicrobiota bacterium]
MSSTAILITVLATAILASGAEMMHLRRCRPVQQLTFGPGKLRSPMTAIAAVVRITSLSALAWSMMTLFFLPAKSHTREVTEVEPKERRHLLLVLDVSPSMRLQDAGETGDISRTMRAAALVQSLLKRITDDKLHISLVAVYNGAKPVVQESRDIEVILNFLDGMPLSSVFPTGKTRLFDGLTEAAKIADPWPADSTTLVLASDGDTVPATGMPRMPKSIGGALVLGVGNPLKGSMIDGRQSRQDVGALRQIATRLDGEYHDGNLKHIPTQLLSELGSIQAEDEILSLSKREYAILAATFSSICLTLLPFLLKHLGTDFRPGPPRHIEGNSTPSAYLS